MSKNKTILSKYGYEIDQNIDKWFARREEDGVSLIRYGKRILYGKEKKEKVVSLQYLQDLEDKTNALCLIYSLKELEDIVKYAKSIKKW